MKLLKLSVDAENLKDIIERSFNLDLLDNGRNIKFLQTRQDKLEELRKCLQQQLLLNTPSAAVFMFLSHCGGTYTRKV